MFEVIIDIAGWVFIGLFVYVAGFYSGMWAEYYRKKYFDEGE